MDVNDAADRLRQLLADAGFNPDRPDPITAWAAFKRFAAEPMDVQSCGVEASPAFKAGVEFAGWSFEVRIDGC
jgi:hypothetical protein